MSDTDFWITPGGLDDQARGFDMYADMAGSAKQWVETTESAQQTSIPCTPAQQLAPAT